LGSSLEGDVLHIVNEQIDDKMTRLIFSGTACMRPSHPAGGERRRRWGGRGRAGLHLAATRLFYQQSTNEKPLKHFLYSINYK
jgi:hypothetical protein